MLFYKKRFYEEASMITDHLQAYFHKLYKNNTLQIFDPYYQDLAKDAIQIDKQLYHKEDLKLQNAIDNIVNLEWIEDEDQLSLKKRVQVYKQDNASMTSFKTTDYIARGDNSVDSMEIDNPSENSTQSLERPSVPV